MEEEASPVFKSSFIQGAWPSPDASLIASIQASRLILQDATTYEIKRTIQLSPDLGNGVLFLKWSSPAPGSSQARIEATEEEDKPETPLLPPPPQRILVADDQVIEVYDVNDKDWKATVNPGFGGSKYVDFGADEDEVVVLSDFQLKVTIWSLKTGQHVDLLYPKVGLKGYGYRPRSNHFALLTRPAAHDVLNLYSRDSYSLITTVILPTTDAQGLKWSPDGRWIAIWEAPSKGYRVVVYTADGHFFREHEQPCVGLGLRSIEWTTGGEYLVLGSYDGRITCLNNFLFNPMVEMKHTTTMKLATTDVWSEEISVHGDRHYTLITPPVNLPVVESPPSDPNPKIGVSAITFNTDSTLIATRDERMPASVWIWSFETLTAIAILVQLSPIRSIQWHPSRKDLLAITCAPDSTTTSNTPTVYLWSRDWSYPRSFPISKEILASGLTFKWIGARTVTNAQQIPVPDEDPKVEDEEEELATADFHSNSIKFVVGDKERFQIVKLEEPLVMEEE